MEPIKIQITRKILNTGFPDLMVGISVSEIPQTANSENSELLQAGGIEDAEMRRTFNMGIGMVLVMSPEAAKRVIAESTTDAPVYHIGEVINGEGVQFS